ncbi:serine/threonine protein kinase japonica group [Bisporella sp. PMI_857]|nr:serine/threonine protein kinase japonica group [Bisporella sp. PMI_857]
MSELYTAPYISQSHASLGREVLGLETAPDQYTFLSFLATAQALDIKFLPITWEAASQRIGIGGTSKVNETPINVDTSLAFKRVRDDETKQRTEENIFRTLINEITVLAQPFVREHPNIVELQGICWDISTDDKPWPVLVFEKSEFGDLYNFVEMPAGRQININERLKLCAEIGTAVASMHSNNIIHGDIKPENVLIFKDKNGEYHAKVIDFGYSTLYADNSHRIKLPISIPWNAPEHDRRAREWTPSEAVRTDLFSFGMLCFWLLFEPYLSGATLLPRDLGDIGLSGSVADMLREMKGECQAYAQLLSASETALGHDKQTILKEFFNSSLSREPEKRGTSLSGLLRMLDPRW